LGQCWKQAIVTVEQSLCAIALTLHSERWLAATPAVTPAQTPPLAKFVSCVSAMLSKGKTVEASYYCSGDFYQTTYP
jgi:hypothetical protein